MNSTELFNNVNRILQKWENKHIDWKEDGLPMFILGKFVPYPDIAPYLQDDFYIKMFIETLIKASENKDSQVDSDYYKDSVLAVLTKEKTYNAVSDKLGEYVFKKGKNKEIITPVGDVLKKMFISADERLKNWKIFDKIEHLQSILSDNDYLKLQNEWDHENYNNITKIIDNSEVKELLPWLYCYNAWIPDDFITTIQNHNYDFKYTNESILAQFDNINEFTSRFKFNDDFYTRVKKDLASGNISQDVIDLKDQDLNEYLALAYEEVLSHSKLSPEERKNAWTALTMFARAGKPWYDPYALQGPAFTSGYKREKMSWEKGSDDYKSFIRNAQHIFRDEPNPDQEPHEQTFEEQRVLELIETNDADSISELAEEDIQLYSISGFIGSGITKTTRNLLFDFCLNYCLENNYASLEYFEELFPAVYNVFIETLTDNFSKGFYNFDEYLLKYEYLYDFYNENGVFNNMSEDDLIKLAKANEEIKQRLFDDEFLDQKQIDEFDDFQKQTREYNSKDHSIQALTDKQRLSCLKDFPEGANQFTLDQIEKAFETINLRSGETSYEAKDKNNDLIFNLLKEQVRLIKIKFVQKLAIEYLSLENWVKLLKINSTFIAYIPNETRKYLPTRELLSIIKDDPKLIKYIPENPCWDNIFSTFFDEFCQILSENNTMADSIFSSISEKMKNKLSEEQWKKLLKACPVCSFYAPDSISLSSDDVEDIADAVKYADYTKYSTEQLKQLLDSPNVPDDTKNIIKNYLNIREMNYLAKVTDQPAQQEISTLDSMTLDELIQLYAETFNEDLQKKIENLFIEQKDKLEGLSMRQVCIYLRKNPYLAIYLPFNILNQLDKTPGAMDLLDSSIIEILLNLDTKNNLTNDEKAKLAVKWSR